MTPLQRFLAGLLACALGLPSLALGAGWRPGAALLDLLPPDPVPGTPLLPTGNNAPGITASALAEALRDHPRHGRDIAVTAVVGPPDGTRVVVLVPQFHRSPVLPVLWSSLGEAVAGVQENVALITAELVTHHGFRCVGTEGSWADRLTRPEELEDLARGAGELSAQADELGRLMGTTDTPTHEAARDVVRVLRPYLTRQLLTLDGVGVALARRAELDVWRLGLEDAALNRRALALLSQMRPLEESMARLEPATQDAGEDEMGRIWREEFPAFDRDVRQPLDAALATLDQARKRALRDKVDLEADAVGRFVRLARVLLDNTLRPQEVASYRDYYAEVAARPADAAPATPRALTAAQRRQKAQLESRLARLRARYEDVASRQREGVAVRRVLARMDALGTQRCVLVMGANHQDALVAQLQKQGRGKVSVVVVQPWVEEDASGPGNNAAPDVEPGSPAGNPSANEE